MMARERVPFPGSRHWTSNDISQGAILLDEIKIRRREIHEFETEIPDHGDRLQEYLRQHYRRADVQVDAALIEIANQGTEQTEVLITRLADRRSVRGRMDVNYVGADRYVDRDGSPRFVSGMQQ